MAVVELPTRSRLRCGFSIRLYLHRTASWVRLDNNAIALGERRSATNLFLGASLLSTRARSCLFDCVRFTLDPDRRSRWSEWHLANQRLFVAGTRQYWIQNSLDSANSLLVQFEQRLPPFSLRWRRFGLTPADFSNCSSYFVGRSFRFLSFAQHRRPGVS